MLRWKFITGYQAIVLSVILYSQWNNKKNVEACFDLFSQKAERAQNQSVFLCVFFFFKWTASGEFKEMSRGWLESRGLYLFNSSEILTKSTSSLFWTVHSILLSHNYDTCHVSGRNQFRVTPSMRRVTNKPKDTPRGLATPALLEAQPLGRWTSIRSPIHMVMP